MSGSGKRRRGRGEGDLRLHFLDQGREGDGALVALALLAQGKGFVGDFLIADKEHVGNFVHFGVSYFSSYFLRSGIYLGAYVCLGEVVVDLLGIGDV